MSRSRTSIDDIPPEFLCAIVQCAAECTALYSTYQERLRTLSALSLTNRRFRQIAQPLLPTYVCAVELEDTIYLASRDFADSIQVFSWCDGAGERNNAETLRAGFSLEPFPFQFVRQLHVTYLESDVFPALNGHAHLTRLSFVYASLTVETLTEDLVFPKLEELSFDTCNFYADFDIEDPPPLFARTQFPSLRALGIREVLRFTENEETRLQLPLDFLATLECFATNAVTAHLPFVDAHAPIATKFLLIVNSPGRRSAQAPILPAYGFPQVQIRFNCGNFDRQTEFQIFLDFARSLIHEDERHKRLYLDLYPLADKLEWSQNRDFVEGVESLEALAREKDVEIIWEDNAEDVIESVVSKEFWRRCRAEKRKEAGQI